MLQINFEHLKQISLLTKSSLFTFQKSQAYSLSIKRLSRSFFKKKAFKNHLLNLALNGWSRLDLLYCTFAFFTCLISFFLLSYDFILPFVCYRFTCSYIFLRFLINFLFVSGTRAWLVHSPVNLFSEWFIMRDKWKKKRMRRLKVCFWMGFRVETNIWVATIYLAKKF